MRRDGGMGLDSSNRDLSNNHHRNNNSPKGSCSPSTLSLNNLEDSHHRKKSWSSSKIRRDSEIYWKEGNKGGSAGEILMGGERSKIKNHGDVVLGLDGNSGDDEEDHRNKWTEESHLNGKTIDRNHRHRHESTDSNDDSDTSSTLERAAPDGGWGWMVVGAAFLVNLVADGVTFSFGVYFVKFLNVFGQSKSATAWIGSLLASMPLLSGPIASSLTDRYGCRNVTIAGSLLSSLGFILSSFAQSVEMLYITFGVLTGFGLSLCYVAAVVIVAYYFEQRRSLATGISVCGGGIGTFIFAPLTQKLIDEYDWQFTTRVFAGFFLILMICGFIMRDLEWTKKSRNSRKLTNSPSLDSSTTREIMAFQPRRLCTSALCIPTFVQEQERLSTTSSNNQSVEGTQRRNYFQSHPLSNNSPPTLCSDSTLSSPRQKSENENPFLLHSNNNPITPLIINFSITGGGITSGTPNKVPTINSSTPNKNNTSTMATDSRTLPSSSYPQPPVNVTTNYGVGIHRHSLTYRGAVISLKRYRLRPASSCPDIISVATTDERNAHGWKAVVADICKWCRTRLEWRSLSSSRFILFIFSNFLLYMWYDILYIYLQDAAKQGNYSDEKSSYLISIVGLFNMIGNLTLGYMGDKEWVDSTLIYGICMVICGFSAMVLPTVMTWNYIALGLDCGFYGFAIAANYSLTSVILVKIVSLERFTNAYGLLLLVQGVGNLVGPPIAGVICDWTGTSSWSFVISGIGIILSSVFILVPKIFTRCSNEEVIVVMHVDEEK